MGLITEKLFALEGKGRDAVLAQNRLSVLMATNNEWAVRSSADERRYFVTDVSDHRRDDRGYFDALVAEIEGGGTAAVLHALLAYDLSGWRVQDVPRTAAMADQKLLAADAHVRWWYDLLNEGDLPRSSGDRAEDTVRISKALLFDQYHSFADKDATTFNPLDRIRFHKWVRLVCPSVVESHPRETSSILPMGVKDARVRVLDIPPLRASREAYEEWISQPVSWET